MTTNMPPKEDKADRSAIPAPPPRPSAAEIAAVKAWIAAGAPPLAAAAKPREFITDAQAVAFMLADLEKIDVRSRHFTRDFTITHLHNAGSNDDQLASYRGGTRPPGAWSRRSTLTACLAIRRPRRRSPLRPRATCPTSAPTGSSSPPRSLRSTTMFLEAKLDVDVAADIKEERRIARAGFSKSGVSVNNRVIERHESSYGSYWKSDDFGGNDPEKGQIIFQRRLGPGKGPFAFRHDGGEIIFSLPNGLQACMLTTADGARLDEGPPNIVKDEKQANAVMVNGVSCMNCHWSGMLQKADQIRPLAEKNVFGAVETATIKALYPPKAEFDAHLKEDADRFAKAVEEGRQAVISFWLPCDRRCRCGGSPSRRGATTCSPISKAKYFDVNKGGVKRQRTCHFRVRPRDQARGSGSDCVQQQRYFSASYP